MAWRREETFALKEMLTADLALRDTADRLFDAIEKAPSDKVSIDLAGVRSMTRSFAHQYLIRRTESKKTIAEKNMVANVRNMLSAVKRTPRKSKFVMLNRAKAKPLKVDLRAYLF